mmetsp:Transcript_14619/g.47769  ORF Transcript_14619/g.47769 Transcript_14619/m.47769 type:complete len:279 (-) Transcript_14619:330-1166(-)
MWTASWSATAAAPPACASPTASTSGPRLPWSPTPTPAARSACCPSGGGRRRVRAAAGRSTRRSSSRRASCTSTWPSAPSTCRLRSASTTRWCSTRSSIFWETPTWSSSAYRRSSTRAWPRLASTWSMPISRRTSRTSRGTGSPEARTSTSASKPSGPHLSGRHSRRSCPTSAPRWCSRWSARHSPISAISGARGGPTARHSSSPTVRRCPMPRRPSRRCCTAAIPLSRASVCRRPRPAASTPQTRWCRRGNSSSSWPRWTRGDSCDRVGKAEAIGVPC